MKLAEQGSVRVGVLTSIPDLLRTYADVTAEQVFAELAIDPQLLENPDNSISFSLMGELLDACAIHTEKPCFGLLLGQNTVPEQLGPLAQLAVYAPNVNSALRSMIVHICIHDRGGAPTLSVGHGAARLGYAIYQPMEFGCRQIYNGSISIMCNLMRSICGTSWTPSEVHFTHARPTDITPYEAFFRAPLVFDSDMDTLIFSDDWLIKPIASADNEQFNLLKQQFDQLALDMDISLKEKIRSIVRPLIIQRNCKHEHVAEALFLHPRTLNRRLSDHGTTLRGIVDEIRFEMARQFLLESEATITEISNLIGYADASILARSFQRWSGTTPSAWRESSRAQTRETSSSETIKLDA